MAYNFVTTSYVEFAIAPLASTIDAITVAAYLKRSTAGAADSIMSFNNSALSGSPNSRNLRVASDNKPYWNDGTNFPNGPQVLSSASIWYLLAFTKAAGASVTPRFHVHDGTSWVHANGSVVVTSFANSGTDRLRVGVINASTQPFDGDIVCVGVKKADSSDATVETLSRTAFQAWRDFGFDWLIGFDASLEAAGILQDQASPGSGDEIAISGTTAVADPPGWAWTSAVTPVADFTGTPLTGTRPLSVAFTDTSTNVPTSWAWTFGDGATSSSQNPTHSYTAAGTYTVTLVATNAAGSNTKTRTAYVTVANPSGTITKIKWGTGLTVTDEGGGVIRVDVV